MPEPRSATGQHHLDLRPGNKAMIMKKSSRLLYLPLLLACLLPAAGCEKNDGPLTLDDLSGGEFVFVERMVILEWIHWPPTGATVRCR